MKRYLLMITLNSAFIVALFSQTAMEPAVGDGSAGNPYQIATWQNLYWISQNSTTWNKYFIQTANIDFADASPAISTWNSNQGWTPVGNTSTKFTGSYNGNYFIIKSLYISRSTAPYNGLFGVVDNGSNYIQNLGVVATNITGRYCNGGLAGQISSGYVTNCFSSGSVYSSENYTGGLIGQNWGGYILKCLNSASVNGASVTGGIAGGNFLSIENCFNSGSVTDRAVDSWCGGITGYNGNFGNPNIGFVNCCYNTGTITANNIKGGVVGNNSSTVSGCYWNTDVFSSPGIGGGTNSGATGLSAANMRVQGNFSGWDFTSTWIMSSYNAYSGFPTLQWTNGYAQAPTSNQIANISNLLWIIDNSAQWSATFTQTADIDASITCSWFSANYNGTGWVPIGNNTVKFSGTYDGGSYSITNLFLSRSDGETQGLFGYVNDGTIKNIGIIKASIYASDGVGMIAGYVNGSSGLIEQCYATGDVYGTSGSSGVAGISGRLETSATIRNCYTNCTPHCGSSSGSYIGGIVGLNYGNIENCYSLSYPYGGSHNGSLIGFNVVTTTSGLFWNTDIFGQGSNGQTTGMAGKTTEQMKTPSTYTDAGWNFSTIWAISPIVNDGYPNLNHFESTSTWDGSENSDWGNPENWDTQTVPAVSSNVIIVNSGFAPIITSGSIANCFNLNINSVASLTINSGGSLITNGTITNSGTITVERSMTDENWHLFSAPNSNTTANSFLGDYMQYWNENGQFWTGIQDPETSLAPMQGYSVWGTAKGSYSFTGTPNTGDKSITLSYHLNENVNKTADGMNLVGNPYPSSIDWALLQPTYGTAYVWNPGTSDYIESTSDDIAPMQGFFIYTTNNESSFTLQNSHRSHGGTFYKEGKVVSNGLLLTATYGDFKDEWILKFDETADDGFTLADDSWKLISEYEGVSQLWSFCPDGILAIDKRPETGTIQLGFANDQAGIYTIGISQIANITSAMLEDTKTNTFHNLQNGTYEFSWDVNDDETRFKLHLNAVGIEETPISESNILIYAANGQIFVKGTDAGKITMSDMMGRVVLQHEISDDGMVSVPVNLQTGVYLVSVQNGQKIKTEKVMIK